MNEGVKVAIDLSKLGLTAKEGSLIIKLVYDESGVVEEIASISKTISVEGEEIPEELANETEIVDGNITEVPEQNITEIPENINITEVLNQSLLQYKAVVGKPVKWIKVLNLENENELKVKIPKKAVNISILTGDEIQQARNELD